jgi:transcriptional regulator with PAS, ATPase and Fis domain
MSKGQRTAQDYHLQYKQLSQKVAEAIQAVLQIDVTIMDNQMVRIAGTGIYRDCIGQTIERKSAFHHCLQAKIPITIKNPGDHNICKDCARRTDCPEKAEICVPIKYKNESVGVIGIIAFTEDQKRKFIESASLYCNFLQKMASLLEAKFSEIQILIENELLRSRIGNIINHLNEALLLFNDRGTVIYKNAATTKLFRECKVDNDKAFIDQVWESEPVRAAVSRRRCDTKLDEIIIRYKNEQFCLLATIFILKSNNGEDDILVSLQDLKKMQEKVMQALEGSQVLIRFKDIFGISHNILEAKKAAQKAAEVDSNVLLLGESGTGKEIFARAIHNESPRASGPFLPINCGAIPDELLESELFGFEKGAFTGAHSTKIGKFEAAEKGTIFLDEISEMPHRLQVKLLRVIQEREICRIGSNRTRKINVRLISATNKDLFQLVTSGLFREDLYYRLNVLPIHIPPLRERKGDILFITDYLIEYYSGMLNRNISGIAEEAKKILLAYDWPGNVRELQNIIEYAVNFESGSVISKELILKRMNVMGVGRRKRDIVSDIKQSDSLNVCLERTEKAILEYKLELHSDDAEFVEKICQDLKISRATFYRKIKKFNISLNSETVSNMRNLENR